MSFGKASRINRRHCLLPLLRRKSSTDASRSTEKIRQQANPGERLWTKSKRAVEAPSGKPVAEQTYRSGVSNGPIIDLFHRQVHPERRSLCVRESYDETGDSWECCRCLESSRAAVCQPGPTWTLRWAIWPTLT